MRYVATKAGPWRVNHDASGKVVVRRVDRDQTEVVIAVATWQDTVTVGRVQTKATVPSDAGWTDIDRAIAVALAAAADMPPDPRLDPGELPPRKPGEKVDGEAKEPVKPMGYFGLAILVLVLGGLAFGLYQVRDYWLWIVQGSGDGANGEACTQDSDCRSDNCARKAPGAKSRVCVPNERKRGERCTSDSECSSGSCERRVCN
jgi:hypothetical protein